MKNRSPLVARLGTAAAFAAFLAVSFASPLSLPTAQAAESEGHGGGHEAHLDGKKLAFQFLNFGILVAILGFFGGKAINGALAARHDQMKKDLEEASATREDALARLKRQETRLANLEAEVTRLRASIKDEAQQEEQRLLAGAEEKSRRIQDETRFMVEQQVKSAELSFRQEVASASARIAEELVRRSFRPEDETRIDQAFIADLESGAAGKGASF
jgi:F-type H+-transporting ATPase subunit b